MATRTLARQIRAKAPPRPTTSSGRLSVVITGGTKGLGKAMAQEFVRHGDNVFVCSRNLERVLKTVVELQTFANIVSSDARVQGLAADVTHGLAEVADEALKTFGCVDVWINNAGTNGDSYAPLMEQSIHDIMSILDTNVLGTILGTREALRIMRPFRQGHVFNMLGGGAEGEPTPQFAVYGATKRAIDQFSKTAHFEETMVQIHRVSPGIVDTELLQRGLGWTLPQRMVRFMARDPDVVARDLVPKMRAVAVSSAPKTPWGTGKHIRANCL